MPNQVIQMNRTERDFNTVILCSRYIVECCDLLHEKYDYNTPLRFSASIEKIRGKRNKVACSVFNKLIKNDEICIIVMDEKNEILDFCEKYIPLDYKSKIINSEKHNIFISGSTDISNHRLFNSHYYYNEYSTNYTFIRYGKSEKYPNLFMKDQDIINMFFNKIKKNNNTKTMVLLTLDDLSTFIEIIPDFYKKISLMILSSKSRMKESLSELYKQDSIINGLLLSFIGNNIQDLYPKINIGECVFEEKKHTNYNNKDILRIVERFVPTHNNTKKPDESDNIIIVYPSHPMYKELLCYENETVIIPTQNKKRCRDESWDTELEPPKKRIMN